MNLRLCLLLYSFLIIVNSAFVAGGRNTSQNTSGAVSGTTKKSSENDEMFKDEDEDDEDDTEGSGAGGVDLESSGSGFGPDDEDTPPATFPVDNTNVLLKSLPEPPELPQSPETDTSLPAPSSSEQPRLPPQPHPEQPSSSEKQPTDKPVSVKNENTYVRTSTADKTPSMEDDNNHNNNGYGVYSVSNHDKDKTISFFAQPGILAAVIGGAVVGLLCAILVVMFIVYRMRKKDEGSYALDEMKRSPASNPYMKPNNHREFYA